MEPLRPGARRFALAWVAVVGLGVVAQVGLEVPRPGLVAAVLAAAGLVGCGRPLRLGCQLELSAAQPVAFAALLLTGTSEALAVAAACVLGAALFREGRLAALKIAFNLAVSLGTILGAGLVLSAASEPGTGFGLAPPNLAPLLLATLLAFPLSTVPVVAAVSLNGGGGLAAMWAARFLPVLPGYLAGSGLALVLAWSATAFGPLALLFLAPLSLLLFARALPALAPQ